MKVMKTADFKLLSVPLNGQGEEMRKKKKTMLMCTDGPIHIWSFYQTIT